MFTHFIPASAGPADFSNPQLRIVLIILGTLAGAALGAFIPARLARRGRHGHTILMASILWAMGLAAMVIVSAIARFRYEKEFAVRLGTGYLDPQTSAPPPWPWVWLAGLAAAYVLLLAIALRAPVPEGGDNGP